MKMIMLMKFKHLLFVCCQANESVDCKTSIRDIHEAYHTMTNYLKDNGRSKAVTHVDEEDYKSFY